MIRCDNLSFRFKGADSDAVSRVNLSINEGEAVAVMGANGSGKSTFARLVAGLLKPTGGEVTVDGDTDPRDRVGILFQNPDNQMISVVVDKEVAFALENRGVPVPEMERKVTVTLEQLGISGLAHRLTTELSGGEKQRVALAALMVYDPPILILDEPDSYLDRAGRQLLDQARNRIRTEHPDLIELRITQYPVVAKMYPRLLVFGGGRVVADAEPLELFNDRERATRLGLIMSAQPGSGNAATSRSERELSVSDLFFAFDTSRSILNGVTFSLATGQISAVVGPTGSGKSTLGNLLCGLLAPDSGSIDVPQSQDGSTPISAVFQQPERQFFLPTCEEEIAFGPKNLGAPIGRSKIEQYLETVGLEPLSFLHRDPVTLSVGEKRRLAFAVILALSPDFIVFDEPTAALDLDGVARFLRVARDLTASGKGLLVITHDGDLVRALADHVLYLPGDGSLTELTADRFFGDERFRHIVTELST